MFVLFSLGLTPLLPGCNSSSNQLGTALTVPVLLLSEWLTQRCWAFETEPRKLLSHLSGDISPINGRGRVNNGVGSGTFNEVDPSYPQPSNVFSAIVAKRTLREDSSPQWVWDLEKSYLSTLTSCLPIVVQLTDILVQFPLAADFHRIVPYLDLDLGKQPEVLLAYGLRVVLSGDTLETKHCQNRTWASCKQSLIPTPLGCLQAAHLDFWGKNTEFANTTWLRWSKTFFKDRKLGISHQKLQDMSFR